MVLTRLSSWPPHSTLISWRLSLGTVSNPSFGRLLLGTVRNWRFNHFHLHWSNEICGIFGRLKTLEIMAFRGCSGSKDGMITVRKNWWLQKGCGSSQSIWWDVVGLTVAGCWNSRGNVVTGGGSSGSRGVVVALRRCLDSRGTGCNAS